MVARIYSPTKSAMQSGRARGDRWNLVFEPNAERQIDSLMGWTGSSETSRQVQLSFDSKDSAIAYAEKHGIAYHVQEPQARRRQMKSYSDNFRFRPSE